MFIIAVGVRTGWVLQQFWADPQRLSYPDEEAYRLAGRSLAAGAGLVDEFGYRATYMPAYPAFIAIFESQQASYLFLRLTQAALAALIAPATFLLARAWMESWQRPRRQGEDSVVMEPSQCRRDFVADGDQDVGSTLLCVPVLAGLAAALDPFLIFFSGLLLTEALFVPAFLLTWWLVVRILNSHRSLRPFDAILIGVGIGVGLVACIMLRPSSSIFVALVPILILVYRRFAAIAWLAATLTVFVVVLGLLPWAARNARVLGEWRWTTTRGGISLYDGLQQGTAGESDLAHTKNDSAIRGLSELQWDRYWHDQAVSAFRKEPGRVIKLAGQKFLRTWNIIPNEAEHRRGTAAVVSAVWMTIILLTAAVGAWRYRREVRALFALLVPVLTVTALHMIFVGSVRYRIPVMPMLFVLASVGFCSLLPRQWLLWWALSNGVSGHGASGRQQSSYQLKPSRCLMPLRWLMGRKRRIIVTAILLLMVVIYGSYRYFTAEPRLRRYAQQWLQSATGGEVRIDRVQFELFSGIRLIGVSVATPATADFYPAGTSFDDRTIFKAEHMWLALQLSNMGGDKPIVPEIVAEKPEFLLVRRDDDRRGNWQALQSSQQKKQSSLRLPGIRCRDASVQECRLSEHGRVQERQYRFDADVVALPDQPYIYELNIAAITRDQGSQLQKDQPLHKDQQQQGNQSYRIRFDTRAGTITSLALPRFSLDELQWLAPPELVRWLSAMQSAGTVAADSFRYDPQTGLRVRVAVNDWKLSLPLDEQESADPLLSRFMQFSEVSGTIELDSQQGTVALEGQFHDRPMRIKGAISLPRTDESSTGQTHSSVDWNGVGFDMEATASQVPLPRNDPQTDMAERRFVERFDRVRAFVHDFDSHGPADLTIRLRKNMG
ncbi:MAG: hypothetical protein FWC56_05435, partial [Phycisphaerae bacterium]|nr:hypothetical protein [Phycisphaerae bacterium]